MTEEKRQVPIAAGAGAAPPPVEGGGAQMAGPMGGPGPREEAIAVEQARSDKIPRNAPCPCGSGKKYKMCHGRPGADPL